MQLRWLLIDVRALGILQTEPNQQVARCAEQLHHVWLH
jgi:hypothetical protein